MRKYHLQLRTGLPVGKPRPSGSRLRAWKYVQCLLTGQKKVFNSMKEAQKFAKSRGHTACHISVAK